MPTPGPDFPEAIGPKYGIEWDIMGNHGCQWEHK
jgi:hypothetical protein